MARGTVFQFRASRSPLHRLDPLSKFVALLAVSFLAFGVYIAWVQIIVCAAVLLAAVGLAWISPVQIWRGTWPFVLACTSFIIIQIWTLPGTHEAFRLFGRPVYAESADYALASALRIYTVLLASLVFVRCTDPRELAIAVVVQLRVPYRIGYAFFIALRIIPTLEEEIKIIRAAQAVRGVARGRGLGGRLRDAGRYAMPLLVSSLRRASMMVMSMEARAFGAYPDRTFVEVPHMRWPGVMTCVCLLVLVAAWYTLLATGVVHTIYVFTPH
jgi:energy-coupling factor transport system permease protein